MTPLTRFLALHALIGFGIAGLFAAMLFGLDVAGLRSLVVQSSVGWVAASALTFLLCLTFGSVQMGIAIMQLESNDTQRGSRRRALPGFFGPTPQPVPVRVRQRSR